MTSNTSHSLFEADLICQKCWRPSADLSGSFDNAHFGKAMLRVVHSSSKSPRAKDFSMLISMLSSMLGSLNGKRCSICGCKLVRVVVCSSNEFQSVRSSATFQSTSPNPVRRAKLRSLLTTHFLTFVSSHPSAHGTHSPQSS